MSAITASVVSLIVLLLRPWNILTGLPAAVVAWFVVSKLSVRNSRRDSTFMIERGRPPGRTVHGSAGTILESRFSVLAVAGHPLAQTLTRNTGLGRDMGNRPALATSNETQTAFGGQRSITVSHRAGPSR